MSMNKYIMFSIVTVVETMCTCLCLKTHLPLLKHAEMLSFHIISDNCVFPFQVEPVISYIMSCEYFLHVHAHTNTHACALIHTQAHYQ